MSRGRGLSLFLPVATPGLTEEREDRGGGWGVADHVHAAATSWEPQEWRARRPLVPSCSDGPWLQSGAGGTG